MNTCMENNPQILLMHLTDKESIGKIVDNDNNHSQHRRNSVFGDKAPDRILPKI